jgi:hypothetical protein
MKNKTENHFSPYPRLRKKLAINYGSTACRPNLNTLTYKIVKLLINVQ